MNINLPAGIESKDYDNYVVNFTKPWNLYLIDRIINEIKKQNKQINSILDVGTGTAHNLIEIAKNPFFAGVKLIGLDFFEDMVIEARQNVLNQNMQEQINIIHGDVHNINLHDNSIDFIFGRSVIHHWENPNKAYQEIYRVLAPQGICIIHEPSKNPASLALNEFNKLRQKCGVPDMSLDEKYTVEEVLEQIKTSGLEKNAVVNQGEGIASLGFELKITKD